MKKTIKVNKTELNEIFKKISSSPNMSLNEFGFKNSNQNTVNTLKDIYNFKKNNDDTVLITPKTDIPGFIQLVVHASTIKHYFRVLLLISHEDKPIVNDDIPIINDNPPQKSDSKWGF